MSAGDSGTHIPTSAEAEDAHEFTIERARAVMKDWVCLARNALHGTSIDLPGTTGIGTHRLGKFASPLRPQTPNPDEVERLALVTGVAAPDIVRRASAFLHPGAPSPKSPMVLLLEPPGAVVLSAPAELKTWINQARRSVPDYKNSTKKLAAKLGFSPGTISSWENPSSSTLPSMDYVELIARACGVPVPTVNIAAVRSVSSRYREYVSAGLATTLAGEILWTGRVLTSHAYPIDNRERNAEIFQARFGGTGDDSSTLQMIGDRYGMTRERVRQIVEKQLLFLQSIKPRTECFDLVAAACERLEPMALSDAEVHLRPLLGEGLGLMGAMDYGVEVLGRRLPFHRVYRKELEPFIVPGHFPDWLDCAVTQAKRLIRHSGAAQLTLAWAVTCREQGRWIDPHEYRKVIEHIPGFDWVDDLQTWFWLGPDGCANRVVTRTIEILAAAEGPLDIEIIYGGLARYSRGRDSDVAGSAGVFPPLEIVSDILSKSPAFQCQQGDDFRLTLSPEEIRSKSGVAQSVVEALRVRGGIASRSELYEAVVGGMKLNPISFSVTLAISPLIRQVDRGLFAIRGWPINSHRLIEAQNTVGAVHSPHSNLKAVVVDASGAVSWLGVLTEGAVANRYAGVPAKAAPHLPPGDYVLAGSDRRLTIHEERRILGLVVVLVDFGATPGSRFRVTFHPRDRSVQVEIISIEPAESADD